MPRRSSPVDKLIEDLQSNAPVTREASVARLRVLGARAVPRLIAFIESSAPARARALALAALEGATDSQATRIALGCLDDRDVDVVVAALAVLRGWVTQESGTTLLEAISAIAVDATRDARIRVAAVDALSDLPETLLAPIRAQAPPPESAGPPLNDPGAAREWVEAHGRRATLATLHDLIKSFRDREATGGKGRHRAEWLKARGAVHGILAERASRLALYDAKETIAEERGPLPAGFIDALRKTGDASCLEALARGWSASRDVMWQHELTDAAQQIVRRSRLSGRSAVIKDIKANWAGFL